MLAREIAEEYPIVDVDADAFQAARIMAERRLPGIVVCDGSPRRPVAVLPGARLIRAIIPRYVQDDPSLARVLDERDAEESLRRLRGATVRDLLDEDRDEIPVAAGDDQVMEIAALMARLRTPLVAVVEGEDLLGVITVAHLLELILPPA